MAGRKQLESLALLPWASRRRTELLKLLDELDVSITEQDEAVCQEANTRPEVRRLMTHPGVGPVTALAFALTLGPAERFRRGKQVGSYFGLIPSEHSSGGKQRLGHISKQGSSFVRGLLVEAAQSAVRREPQLRREYRRLSQRRCRALAKVDLRPELPRIKNPTLVVVGSLDAATPPALAHELASGIPGARLVELPGCGHCPPLQQPREFLAAIAAFLGAGA